LILLLNSITPFLLQCGITHKVKVLMFIQDEQSSTGFTGGGLIALQSSEGKEQAKILLTKFVLPYCLP